MGIWHLPKTDKQKIALQKKLDKLRKLTDSIMSSVGDDILLDHLELAGDRIEKFCTHVTEECKHPAFYPTGTGQLAPGVCQFCRLNLKD